MWHCIDVFSLIDLIHWLIDQMLRVLSGESYSSVKSAAVPTTAEPAVAAAAVSFYQHQQAAMTHAAADVPLKSVLDSGIDSILDSDKSGRQHMHGYTHSITQMSCVTLKKNYTDGQ